MQCANTFICDEKCSWLQIKEVYLDLYPIEQVRVRDTVMQNEYLVCGLFGHKRSQLWQQTKQCFSCFEQNSLWSTNSLLSNPTRSNSPRFCYLSALLSITGSHCLVSALSHMSYMHRQIVIQNIQKFSILVPAWGRFIRFL